MLMDSRERYVSVYSKSSASHKVLLECLTVMNDESMHMTWPKRWCRSLCSRMGGNEADDLFLSSLERSSAILAGWREELRLEISKQ